jgi:hypothetical protein
MPHEDDRLTIARERIAEEAQARTGSLDLGMLGSTSFRPSYSP